MNNKALLVADGNWLLHRAFHAKGNSVGDQQSKIAAQVTNWVFSAAIRWSTKNIAVFFDGDAVFRYLIYPEYKAKRASKDKNHGSMPMGSVASDTADVYSFLNSTVECLRLCGVYVEQKPEFEADDLLCSAAHRWSLQGSEYSTVILAKDKDIRQCVNEQVTVYASGSSTSEELIWTPRYFLKVVGLTPKQWLRYQVLVGDTIDNIPSCMSKAKAKSVVKRFASLKEFFESEEGIDFYSKNKRQLKLNRLLVTLRTDSWEDELRKLSVTPIKHEALKEHIGLVPKSASAFHSLSTSRPGLFSK